MTETEWNSTTAPEEGAIVYVLAVDDRGQYLIPFPVVFRDDSWWNAPREKSSILLSRDGGQLRMSNDDARCIAPQPTIAAGAVSDSGD